MANRPKAPKPTPNPRPVRKCGLGIGIKIVKGMPNNKAIPPNINPIPIQYTPISRPTTTK